MNIKVYAVGFPQGKKVNYITPKTRINIDYRHKVDYICTKDIDEASHYETRKDAEEAVKNFFKVIDRRKASIEREIKKITTDSKDWRHQNASHYIAELKADKSALTRWAKEWNNPEVFEHETEELESNLFRVRKHKIQFIKNWDGTRYSCGRVETITETTNKHYCKMCGIRMKNIPFLFFDDLNNLRICVKCATALGDRARSSWESVDEARRDLINKEHFLNQLED
jgi:rRNA maturation endonuclease Nob1